MLSVSPLPFGSRYMAPSPRDIDLYTEHVEFSLDPSNFSFTITHFILVTKFRDARVAMKPSIPFFTTTADLGPCVEANADSVTAMVRSSGVASPIREGTPSTNITLIERTCSACTVAAPTDMSALIDTLFLVFPFIVAMSVPYMSSAIAKSLAVTLKLMLQVAMSIALLTDVSVDRGRSQRSQEAKSTSDQAKKFGS